VIGWFTEEADFGGAPLRAAGDMGGTDVFVARYAADGEHLWSRRLGNVWSDYGTAIAYDGAGDLRVAIRMTRPKPDEEASGAGGENDDGVRSDVVVARLTGEGATVWERHLEGSQYAAAAALGVDGEGAAVIGGGFLDRLDGPGGALVSAGRTDGFAARWSADGELVWQRRFGDACSDRIGSLAVAAGGDIVLAGAFECELDLGGGPMQTEREDWDAYAAKLGPDGAHVWSQSFGGDRSDRSLAVAIAADGSAALSGEFYGRVDIGGGDFETHGYVNLLLAKFSP
jgi:hypothetical protein